MKTSATMLVALLLATTGCAEQDSAPRAPAPAAPAAAAAPASAADEAAAQAMADAIVAAFDADDIASRWALASPTLSGMSNEADFTRTITDLRAQVGAAGSRRLLGVDISSDLPDTPPGTYATIFYTTEFANVGELEEKVVLEDVGGTWRLAGYYLKKLSADAAG